ncbi:MAG: VWA domain-containing protein [Acidobacteriia bacterium]|nr:VWA domain-containing protein [Terriglobia bacterium]
MKKLWSILLLSVAPVAPAQEPETPIKVDVDVVNVLCTVYDKRGALVQDLAKDDFEIRENGQRQEIRYFARDTDLPLTVALLVDVSGSVARFIADEKEATSRFLETVLRPTDHALLLGFSSTLILWQDFTSSTESLRAALAKLRSVPFRGLPGPNQPMPSTMLYDGVAATAARKLAGVSGRKTMVIISDGLDNGSQTHLEEAIKAVQSTNTIVYGICYESGFSGCSFLKDMAEPTGGRMFQAGKKTPLEKIFETIERELRSQYSLGYASTNRAHDGSFRKLELRVKRRGLRVQVRRGYYAIKERQE